MQEIRNETVEFGTVLKIFIKKIKIIVAFALVVFFAAGLLGIIFAPSPVRGTTLMFSVDKKIEDDSMLTLLSSEKFAELLLLDENGLPAEKKSTDPSSEYMQAKNAADAYRKDLEYLDKIDSEINDLKFSLTHIEAQKNIKNSALSAITTAMGGDNGTNAALNEEYKQAKVEYDEAAEKYRKTLEEISYKESEKFKKSDSLLETKEIAHEKAEVLLAPWRSEKKKDIAAVKKSVVCYYPEDNKSGLFIVADVFVEKSHDADGSYTESLVKKVMNVLPEFVETNLSTISNGSLKTVDCTLITTGVSITSTNNLSWVVYAVIFAVAGALGTLVAAMAVIAIIRFFKHALDSAEDIKKAEITAKEPIALEAEDKAESEADNEEKDQ